MIPELDVFTSLHCVTVISHKLYMFIAVNTKKWYISVKALKYLLSSQGVNAKTLDFILAPSMC